MAGPCGSLLSLVAILMTGIPTEAPEPAHFFRNYNRLIGAAYGGIVVALFGFFLYQLNQKFDDEVRTIQGHLERHGQFIEFVLKASTEQLEALRMEADSLGADAANGPPAPSPLRDLLAKARDGNSFHLDALPDRDAGGNLVGLGALSNRGAVFDSDVGIALGLNNSFRSLAFSLPNAARVYYRSPEQFELVFPWQPSDQIPFDTAVYQQALWTLGLPEANPDHRKYWAPVYFGGKDQGLLVPAAAPVYDGQRFAGIVAIDTSLDYLNRVNSGFGYPLGTAFVVDAYGKVLADPRLYADPLKVEQAPHLDAALSAALASSGFTLRDLPQNTPTSLAGELVLRHSFRAAPWDLVYVVPSSQLWTRLLAERGAGMAAVLVGLTLLMLVTYAVTSREFVGPAAKLVQHLAAESQFQPKNIPAVPTSWKPWFEAVSRAFSESMQLIGLRQELDIAAKMQQSILPRHWPHDADYTLWGTMRSAKEVGGDFYDHFVLPGGAVGMVCADVSGKGVPASLFAMVSKTLLRSVATRTRAEPGTVISDVNDELCVDNDSCMFVTTLYASLVASTGKLNFVNAGHPPPLLLHVDGRTEFLPGTGGMALGVMEDQPFRQASTQLEPGDMLLIYTDGVTEAMNPEQEEFGMQRLSSAFALRHPESPREAVEALIRAVDNFAAGAIQSDDITCVALHYHPQSPCAPAAPFEGTT